MFDNILYTMWNSIVTSKKFDIAKATRELLIRKHDSVDLVNQSVKPRFVHGPHKFCLPLLVD